MSDHSTNEASEKRLFNWLRNAQDGRPWDELSKLEKTVLLVYRLECEVANGGFDQYFVNPSGDNWHETLDALQRIGSTRITSIFERAIALFPNAQPSNDQLTRSRQLREAGRVANQTLEALTEEYYGLHRNCPEEDSYAIMSRLAAERE